jgi:hypothetical protein
MSKHGTRHRQPPPIPVPAPPFMPKPGRGVLRGGVSRQERLWLFAIALFVGAAAVIAIFSAGYVTGVASVTHG